jgi:hypothetical protein
MGLAGLPTWVCVLLSLIACAMFAVVARLVVERFLQTAEQRSHALSVAGPLMPALGAAFALLSALSLAGEASHLRTAEENVSQEGAASARLAWAATTPGVQPREIQGALGDYLVSTRTNEWSAGNEDGNPEARAALARLERAVRAQAGQSTVGSGPAGELLASIDAVSSARRQRLATATRGLPGLYVGVVAFSGLALIGNAAALSAFSSRRVALLITGLVAVVGLSIALLFAISAPFSGGFLVGGGPLDEVINDLHSGFFAR